MGKVAQEYPDLEKTEAMSTIMSYPSSTNYSREPCCACVCIIKKTYSTIINTYAPAEDKIDDRKGNIREELERGVE